MAGVAGDYTVTAKDGFGNPTPAYSGTVTLTSYGHRGESAGPAVRFSSGSARTFSVTLKTAGSRTVHASDGTINSSPDATTVVSHAALDHFVVTTGALQTAGTSFAVGATAKDAFNNTVSNYTGTPALGNNFSATGGSPVAGTFTPFAAGQGTATGTTDFTAEERPDRHRDGHRARQDRHVGGLHRQSLQHGEARRRRARQRLPSASPRATQ